MHRQLHEKISTRSLRVAVIGLGYVGLPLAITFAEAGFQVEGIDVDKQKVDLANRGESYIPDISSSTLQALIQKNRLHFTSDYAVLDEIDAISICVPTPLRKTRDPDISYIVSVTHEVQAHLHAGQLIVLESTTYPGTTNEVLLPVLESTPTLAHRTRPKSLEALPRPVQNWHMPSMKPPSKRSYLSLLHVLPRWQNYWKTHFGRSTSAW